MKYLYIVLITIILTIGLYIGYQEYTSMRKEIATLEQQLISATNDVDYYRDLNGQLSVRVSVIEADYNKVKESNNELITIVEKQRKELKLKPKDLEQAVVIVTKTDTVFKTLFKDSCYIYKDLYNDFEFCKDSSKVSISDSISGIIYNERYIPDPSKLFFIRWFQKKEWRIIADVRNKNSLIKIKDAKFILNTKKRKK